MTLRCWLLVFDTHRECWFGVELGGYCLAFTDGQLVRCQICRVNRQNSITTEQSSVAPNYLIQQMPRLYKDSAALFAKGLVQAHMRTSNP